jgi:hypothetical protein
VSALPDPSKPDEIREFLGSCQADDEVGGLIEVISELEDVQPGDRALYERFLGSNSLSNRSAALEALIVYCELDGYEGEVVFLHFQSRADQASFVRYDTVRQLIVLRDRGSSSARRILELLQSDPFFREMY